MRDYQKFDKLIEGENYPWKVKEILPKVLVAGDAAGILTEEGAKKLDPTGNLERNPALSSGAEMQEQAAERGHVPNVDGKPHRGDGRDIYRTALMDYKIRKVPRDVLLLCMAGTVLIHEFLRVSLWACRRPVPLP